MSKYIKQKQEDISKKERKLRDEEYKQQLKDMEAEEHIEVEEIVDLSKAEKVVEKNYKSILFGALAIVLVAAAFILFKGMNKGKESKAQAAAFYAQNSFADKNWLSALNGSDGKIGFTEIAKKYKGTNVGNLANYYAGVSHVQLGQFEEAVHYLSSFKFTNDPTVNGLAAMNLGDAYMETGKESEAVAAYKKAANSKSEVFEPEFLYRYALALVKTGDNAQAKSVFEQLKTDYPETQQGKSALNYIAGL